ncbi:dihydrodipicolinate synthase family protein [Bacteroidota bacterium]
MTEPDEKIKSLQGIIGVINTPFTDDNRIDTESIKRYVNHSIGNGVVGFLVPAMAAEVGKLTFDERREIVKIVVDEVRGKVIVIGGASATNQIDRINNVKMLTNIGCDGILVSIPYENEGDYKRDIKEVAQHVGGFLMIQDWDFDGFGIPVDTIVRLFDEIDVFKYLKVEVKPAGVKYSKVIEATNGKLHVSGGWAGTQMIEALDRGVNAFMPTILHDVYNRIFQLHQQGKRDDAIKLFNKLLPIISFSHQHVDISIHFNKRLVHNQGMFSTPNVRQPILTFDKYHEKVSDELIEYAIQLSSSLNHNKE